jgi:hypothetical protein
MDGEPPQSFARRVQGFAADTSVEEAIDILRGVEKTHNSEFVPITGVKQQDAMEWPCKRHATYLRTTDISSGVKDPSDPRHAREDINRLRNGLDEPVGYGLSGVRRIEAGLLDELGAGSG